MEGYTAFCFFSLSGYRYLGDGGTDRREILHEGTYWSRTDILPFGVYLYCILSYYYFAMIELIKMDGCSIVCEKNRNHSCVAVPPISDRVYRRQRRSLCLSHVLTDATTRIVDRYCVKHHLRWTSPLIFAVRCYA